LNFVVTVFVWFCVSDLEFIFVVSVHQKRQSPVLCDPLGDSADVEEKIAQLQNSDVRESAISSSCQFAAKMLSYVDFNLLFQSLTETIMFISNRAVFVDHVRLQTVIESNSNLRMRECECERGTKI
jgi:hypothetical protein